LTIPQSQPGDTFLILRSFGYDLLSGFLPVRAGPGVYLDYTPQDVLRWADQSDVAERVLQAYALMPGYPNWCLRCVGCATEGSQILPSDLMFVTITALRLRAPIAVEPVGQFTLGGDGASIESPRLYHVMSPWQPDPKAKYSAKDVRFAAGIARQLLTLLDPRYGRVARAIAVFSQVTTGQSLAFAGAYLALYAVLEGLFAPQDKKAETLATRVGSFLAGVAAPAGWCVEQWLENDYIHGRSQLAHGIGDVAPWEKELHPRNKERIGRLHEMCRLCILGFMSLPDATLQSIGMASGTPLQNHLKSLAPACGPFLKDQRVWCD